VWIEGLDKINNAPGAGKRGISMCVDLSATPFYISGSGYAENSPFPWLVSDFGLVDAIESGITKIPRMPVLDTTGRPDPRYFRLWDAIDAEIEKLQKVRALLSGVVTATTKAGAPAKKIARRRRKLSPEARKRIADAQKKRWAAVKAAKESTKPAASKRVKKEAPAKKLAFTKTSAKKVKNTGGKKAVRKASSAKAKKASAQRATLVTPSKAIGVAVAEAASS